MPNYTSYTKMWETIGGTQSVFYRMPSPFGPTKKEKVDEAASLARAKLVISALRSLRKRGIRKLEFDSSKRLIVDVDMEVVETPLADEHARIWESIHAAMRKAERIKAEHATKEA